MPKKQHRRKPSATEPRDRWRAIAVLILAAVGGALAAWLVWIHLALKREPEAGSACNLGGLLDCDVVNASRFASVLGVPIAYCGLAMYLILGALALAELRRGGPARVAVYARLLGTLAVAYSMFLASVSATVLHAVCLFCVGLYGVNLGLAVLGWWCRTPRSTIVAKLNADLPLLFGSFRPWRAQIALALLVLGAIATRQIGVAFEAAAQSPTSGVTVKRTLFTVAPGHAEGPADARLVVVEFTDFECPHCRRANETLEGLRAQHADRVQFVIKHFPLDRSCNRAVWNDTHRRSCTAAHAAVCAGEQGRLWPFQNAVFERGVDEDALDDAARAAGLDVARWRRCRWTARARDSVLADVEDGLRIGIRRTPTFLVGDQVLAGGGAVDRISGEIDRALAVPPR